MVTRKYPDCATCANRFDPDICEFCHGADCYEPDVDLEDENTLTLDDLRNLMRSRLTLIQGAA